MDSHWLDSVQNNQIHYRCQGGDCCLLYIGKFDRARKMKFSRYPRDHLQSVAIADDRACEDLENDQLAD